MRLLPAQALHRIDSRQQQRRRRQREHQRASSKLLHCPNTRPPQATHFSITSSNSRSPSPGHSFMLAALQQAGAGAQRRHGGAGGGMHAAGGTAAGMHSSCRPPHQRSCFVSRSRMPYCGAGRAQGEAHGYAMHCSLALPRLQPHTAASRPLRPPAPPPQTPAHLARHPLLHVQQHAEGAVLRAALPAGDCGCRQHREGRGRGALGGRAALRGTAAAATTLCFPSTPPPAPACNEYNKRSAPFFRCTVPSSCIFRMAMASGSR